MWPRTGNSGETGSLSFLYFLRRTLKPYVGLIRFTDIERENAMQEIEVQHVNTESLECPPARMYQLLDYYFEAVGYKFMILFPLTHSADQWFI